MLVLRRFQRCVISQEQTVQNFLQFVLKNLSSQAASLSSPLLLDPQLLGKVGGGLREVEAPKNGW